MTLRLVEQFQQDVPMPQGQRQRSIRDLPIFAPLFPSRYRDAGLTFDPAISLCKFSTLSDHLFT